MTPDDRRVSLLTAGLLRARHFSYLLFDLAWLTKVNRTWWLLPIALLALAGMAIATTTQAFIPYTVYTLF